MKYVKRNVLIATIVILGLYVSSASVMAAPVGEVTYSPSDAAPLSTITFNATVSGDDINEVRINVKECKDPDAFCYSPRHNVSMTEVASGKYQATVTLEHNDATYIGYWLIVNSGGIWYNFQDDMIDSDLTIPTSNGQQDDGDGTPGFELILMLVSIAIIVFMLQRKR